MTNTIVSEKYNSEGENDEERLSSSALFEEDYLFCKESCEEDLDCFNQIINEHNENGILNLCDSEDLLHFVMTYESKKKCGLLPPIPVEDNRIQIPTSSLQFNDYGLVKRPLRFVILKNVQEKNIQEEPEPVEEQKQNNNRRRRRRKQN
jgi:hypothetical protein